MYGEIKRQMEESIKLAQGHIDAKGKMPNDPAWYYLGQSGVYRGIIETMPGLGREQIVTLRKLATQLSNLAISYVPESDPAGKRV